MATLDKNAQKPATIVDQAAHKTAQIIVTAVDGAAKRAVTTAHGAATRAVTAVNGAAERAVTSVTTNGSAKRAVTLVIVDRSRILWMANTSTQKPATRAPARSCRTRTVPPVIWNYWSVWGHLFCIAGAFADT